MSSWSHPHSHARIYYKVNASKEQVHVSMASMYDVIMATAKNNFRTGLEDENSIILQHDGPMKEQCIHCQA
jgi:hypothetical protein